MKLKLITIMLFLGILIAPVSAGAMADSAQSACIINGITGDVIFEKNSGERLPMASTTKIMTSIIALENSSLDEVLTISEEAQRQEGSSAYLQAGDEVYMRDVLHGLMLNSGNDAAYAIAEHISGSREAFADLMNDCAWNTIGAVNTQFTNPSGLDGDGHYSTSYDMALIMRYAMRIPEFCEITATHTMAAQPLNRDEEIFYTNHNKLLNTYKYCIGGKTGFTQTSGRCLVSAAEYNGMMFVAVTLNDPNDWESHSEMYDYAFSTHRPKKATANGQVVKTAVVDGEEYKFVYADDFIVPVMEDKRAELKIVNHLSSDLTSPVNKGEKVGWADIYQGETKIKTVDIISASQIHRINNMRLKKSFFGSFIRALNLWLM